MKTTLALIALPFYLIVGVPCALLLAEWGEARGLYRGYLQ